MSIEGTNRMTLIFDLPIIWPDHAVVRSDVLVHVFVIVDRQDCLAQTT